MLAPDGEEHWLSITALPFADGAEGAFRVLSLWRDVTGHRRAVRGLQLIADASTLLASSLDYASILPVLARRLVPELADGCSMDVLNEEGVPRPVALTFSDAAGEEAARELRERYPRQTEAIFQTFLRGGRPVLNPRVREEDLRQSITDAEHLRLILRMGLRSSLMVPLVARGRVLGILNLVSARSGRDFDEAALALAKELAFRIALAVDDAGIIHRLQGSEERLRLALDAGRMGIFDQDLTTKTAVISPSYERLLGLAPGTYDGSFEAFTRNPPGGSRGHPPDHEGPARGPGRAHLPLVPGAPSPGRGALGGDPRADRARRAGPAAPGAGRGHGRHRAHGGGRAAPAARRGAGGADRGRGGPAADHQPARRHQRAADGAGRALAPALPEPAGGGADRRRARRAERPGGGAVPRRAGAAGGLRAGPARGRPGGAGGGAGGWALV